MNDQKTNRSESAKGGAGLLYVVDDEPMLLELAAVILAPLGYTVQTFRNPEAAIRDFSSAQPKPDLIITDYAMQPINGMEVIEACRRIRPEQKALVLSGTVGPDFFYNTPVKPDRFLAKPYQAKQLVEMVRSMLSQ